MKVIRNFKLVTPELCEAGGAGRVGGGWLYGWPDDVCSSI